MPILPDLLYSKLETQQHANQVDLSSTELPTEDELENAAVGFLFASKALVQMVFNPLVGRLTRRWVEEMITLTFDFFVPFKGICKRLREISS